MEAETCFLDIIYLTFFLKTALLGSSMYFLSRRYYGGLTLKQDKTVSFFVFSNTLLTLFLAEAFVHRDRKGSNPLSIVFDSWHV